MKARIKKSDIEAFKIHASAITNTSDVKIYDFLKVDITGDFCTITKSNLKSFAKHTFESDSEDCSFLLDESMLYNFSSICDTEYINFDINGARVKIFDGSNQMSCTTDLPTLFQKISYDQTTWTDIPKSALDACGLCTNIIMDGEIPGKMSTIFMGLRAVCASDGSFGFMQDIDGEVPKLSLRKEVATAISKMSSCEYASTESYDLFRSGGFVFGFSKLEIGFADIRFIFDNIDPCDSFYIEKSKLVKWNTACINSTKSKLLTATWEADDSRLRLSLVESKFEFNADSTMQIVDGFGSFKFDPNKLNTLLKVLPCEQVFFTLGDKRCYVTNSDKTCKGVIMLIN